MATPYAEADADELPLAERVRAARLPSPDERARIRRESGATLRDVAAELARRGCRVSPMTVHRWETGQDEPRLHRAIAYRQVLDEIQAAIS
jgi:DNA-binding XRE family transcriptional regulator